MVDSKVKVAVRVRPMNQKEIDLKSECVVYMEGKQTVLKFTSHTYEGDSKSQKEFVFDHCFWSVDNEGPASFASQEDIFKTIGEDILDSIFAGFNSCIFAYGQTGSGKTFSMMGTDDQPGLVPRLCSSLFRRNINNLKSLQVEAAYLEIYNEKVRDLLYPTSDFKTLKVREHKTFGPYVEGLSHHVVSNTEDIKSLILEGNKCRIIANTKMNEQSSRSHAIFTLTVTQTLQIEHGVLKELLSKVSLVDLAGIERTYISGATGDQLKESSNINKSLTFLGVVINSLAELSEGKRRSTFVNYRDSKLTWLLKNNLGGNSKTVMLATISPASVYYQETLSTLNYADSAKRIVNKATVNEDIKSKAITELKEEVKRLREQLQQAEATYKQELEEKLNESEKLLKDLKVSWEEKLKMTQMSALERQKKLQRLGITVEHTGIRVDKDKCYLINLSTNSDQNAMFLYYLGGKTKIGACDSQDIQVIGPGIELEHCVIDIEDGKVFLTPNKNAETFVNSSRVQTGITLGHEDRIQLGTTAHFLLRMPNSKPKNTKEDDKAVNVILNESEEQNPPGNKSIHEESDMIVGPDISAWSYGDNTNSSEPLCTFSNDFRVIGSSSEKDDISQNRSIVSPEISHNKHLEDQDSCDIKNTTIESKVSPNGNKNDGREQKSKDDGDDRFVIITSTSQSEMEPNSEYQISYDSDKIMSINPTFQVEIEQNTETQITKGDDKTDISISSISHTENKLIEQYVRNQISKSDDKTDIFCPAAQAEIEEHIGDENQIFKGDEMEKNTGNQISKVEHDKTDVSITSISPDEIEQNLKSYKEIPKEEDTSDVPITQTSQNLMGQILGYESQTCKDNNKMGRSKQASKTENEQIFRSQNQIFKDDYDISINTSQADIETKISKDIIDGTKVNSISQAELVQDLSSKKQIFKNNSDKNDISITSKSKADMEQDLSGESQISKGDDDKTNVSINLSSQAKVEKHLCSTNQMCNKDEEKTGLFITLTSQTEGETNLSKKNQIFEDRTEISLIDESDITITSTSKATMEQNTGNQISKEEHDKTDVSITSISPSEIELNAEYQISKDSDKIMFFNPTSHIAIENHFKDKQQISEDKEDDNKINEMSINSTSQTEMEQNTGNLISKEEHDKTDVSITSISQAEIEQNNGGKSQTSKDDDKSDIFITSVSQVEMEQQLTSQSQISKDIDKIDISIIPTTQIETIQNICMERETSKGDNTDNISITPKSETEMEENVSSEHQIYKDKDKTDLSITSTSQGATEEDISIPKDDDISNFSLTESQAEMKHYLERQNQQTKDYEDKIYIPITSTSQTEMEQNTGNQISKEEHSIIDVSITPSQAEKEQNNGGKSQISKDDDDKSNIFIALISQVEMEQQLKIQNQKCKDNDKIDISIIPTTQTETIKNIFMESETSKGENTDYNSIIPTSKTEMEENVSSEHPVSKDDDKTDPPITSTSQGATEENLSSTKQIYKEDDASDNSLTLISQVEMKHHLDGQIRQSKDNEDKTVITISTSQAEIEQNTIYQISRDDNIAMSIDPTSHLEIEHHFSGKQQISKDDEAEEDDNKINKMSINSTSQTEMEQNLKSYKEIPKGGDTTDVHITQTSQNVIEQILGHERQTSQTENIRSQNQISKEDYDISINTSQADIESDLSSEKQISKNNDDKNDISIISTSKADMEQDLSCESKISKEKEDDDDKTNVSINLSSQAKGEQNVSITNQMCNKDEETLASQTERDTNLSNKNLIFEDRTEISLISQTESKKPKDDDDKSDITITSTSKAIMEQNTGNQISKEEHDKTDVSITSISPAEIEQNIGSQITKGDDKNDISITSISQTDNKLIEQYIKNQISKSDDKTDIFCPAAQAEVEERIGGENQIFKGDDEFDILINPISKTVMEQNIRSKSKTSSVEDRNDTPTSPSECFIEDNIAKSESSLEIYGTNERQTGAAMVAGPSDQAVNYIRRSRKEIMETLQKDFDDFLDECDSKDIITQEEYRKVENTNGGKQKARSLLNIILEKDEATCRAFLQCLNLNQGEKDFPVQETKKSHIEEPKAIKTDKDLSASTYEDIHLPKANLKIESKKIDKRTCFQDLLMKMNFQSYQKSKLTLHDVLDIGVECVRPGFSHMENVAWHYLRKLMSLHKEARNISTIGNSLEMNKNSRFLLDVDCDMSGSIHPLDLQCTILHCSDHFLQQEMISKMSMCQFSVPLLLPATGGPDCTLMLWAMRGIVKKWRPQSLSESRGFQEEHLVKISMPTFSFVRLGKCRLSKSNILNKILTSTQHYQDIFVHRDMDGGNVERSISMGLVEMSWYFPAGKGIFAEPVAFTNLRGELESNVKTFDFLAEISTVVVIFAEAVSKAQCEFLLKYRNSKTAFLFIIVPEEQKSKGEIEEMLESLMSITGTKKDNILVITKSTNEAATVKKIHSVLLKLEKENCNFLSIEEMAKTAIEQGICVDEREKECQVAEKKAKAITEEISDVVNYKEKTMKLQAQLLRDLARLEKELCQMKQQHNKNGEKYKSELRRKCDEIRRKQWECHMPEGIVQFMKGIGAKNRSEKFYFLSWLKYYLDLAARKTLTSLQEVYKEKYSQARNSKELTEIDQKISDSSLGIEHFMREISQFYEAWNFIGKHKMECTYLSEAAADLLLDGYPLELIDGDASRIPVQWIIDVLNKVNTKTGDRCRIRVITVLGVQSTGKSTLLNTMFGLQYPVASGRCTRGAFMTLIKVKENVQVELGCEYLLVIDTEGLKAPELDSLEGSYEHDNELATLVVGLSDITVINMAMENITEMKDIIQIVIHSFLRMKEIGKKPNCQFVHQNVSDVSAHEKNMRDRNKLLEQLNEMTQTVATMEKKPQYKVFSDVMEYDSEQHHWYIPSLWQGVPPMAPISAGYSEHIAELKLNLLKMIKQSQTGAQTIPQFVRWTEDLWNAVKHENFIFSFRNSLVASAYNKLSMKYSELEWKFNKLIHEWLTNTETIIKNQSEDTLEDKGRVCCIRLENIISIEQNKMITWVEDYFQQNKDCVNLIRYKEDFINSAKILGKNLRMASQDKYFNAMQIQKQQLKIKKVRMQYIEGIEKKVSSLMEDCRKKQHQLDNENLKTEFEIMWQETVKELGVKPLIKHDIEKVMLLELTKTMRDKGSAVNEKLNQIQHLPKPEKKHTGGKIKAVYRFIKSSYKWWKGNLKHEDIIQSILEKCCRYSEEQARKDGDYDDTYCKQLLNMIDDSLTKEGNIPAEQELDIKFKILGHVVADFQEMHNNFIKKNDPHSQLDTLKSEYFNSFMDVFQEKNKSQNLAKRICDTCLKPEIVDHIIRNLGIELVDDIMRSEGSATYTSRTFFQYTVLLDLLEENKFKKYVKYSRNYEKFVKKWILKYVKGKYKSFITMEIKILSGITKKIRDVLNNPEMLDRNLEDFLRHFQDSLSSDLVFPKEKMKAIIFENCANTKEFIKNLDDFLSDTEKEILSDLEALGTDVILSRVSVKPQDELFKKVFGCGKQCPFCKVPCEAGGEDHKEHFASVHRPKGLGTYRCSESLILCHDICTTSVCGNKTFVNTDTNEKPHPYKKYKDYYPDWRIQPDPSIKAADYWKFVLKEFNDQFATQYNAKPADYPKEWNNLTKEMAKESLKKTFNM